MRTRPPVARGARAGMTLVELLIAITLLSVVMGTILTVVTRQQRFYRSASEIIETRSQLRSATAILPVELRGVSTQVRDAAGNVVGSDLLAIGPNMIEFRSTFGAGVVCDVDVAQTTVTLYPDVLASNGLRFGGFLYEPGPGDLVYLLNNGAGGSADDTWDQRTVTASGATTALCTAGLAGGTAEDLALDRRQFTLAAPTSAVVGAPVRVARTVKYELYQDATSGLWYLGQSVMNAGGAYDPIQPVAGPYLPATNDSTTSGLFLRYVDVNGNIITTTDLAARQSVTRVDIIVRGRTTNDVNGSGFGTGNKIDRQNISVAIRNRG
jgi:prepilin-type N-terminal cleavage/methylation domain-containing protein